MENQVQRHDPEVEQVPSAPEVKPSIGVQPDQDLTNVDCQQDSVRDVDPCWDALLFVRGCIGFKDRDDEVHQQHDAQGHVKLSAIQGLCDLLSARRQLGDEVSKDLLVFQRAPLLHRFGVHPRLRVLEGFGGRGGQSRHHLFATFRGLLFLLLLLLPVLGLALFLVVFLGVLRLRPARPGRPQRSNACGASNNHSSSRNSN
mmetsp:Transcript_124382/g.348374  ORF Transcript_124382/g.348374 Transcript_124382/m.348374 type:complete len:201 (+) Transcript_124382:1116-1718(+)